MVSPSSTTTTTSPRSRRPFAVLSRVASLAAFPVLLAALWVAGACTPLTPYPEVVRTLPEGGRLVDVGGRRVYIEERGKGEPVVLVHGFGASSYSWRKVAPRLAERYRVIALDLSGFGFTDRPEGREAYTRAGQVELIRGVMDALGIERAHLVGHSYGGALSVAFAVAHPDRLIDLALVDSAAPEYTELRRTKIAAFAPLTRLFVRWVALDPDNVERALESSVANEQVITPEVVAAYYRRLAIEGAGRAYWGLTAPSPDPPAAIDYGELEGPVLLVWGAEDRLITVADARRSAARISRSALVVIEGSGHLPMEERPEELARVLGDFFRDGLPATATVPAAAVAAGSGPPSNQP